MGSEYRQVLKNCSGNQYLTVWQKKEVGKMGDVGLDKWFMRMEEHRRKGHQLIKNASLKRDWTGLWSAYRREYERLLEEEA